METLKPASFVIDVLTIKKRAGKPHHVEARFARRNKENFCEYVNRRNAFIEARKSKLERRGAHVKQVLAEQKKRDDGASTAALTRISDAIQAAEQKRKEIIERQKQTFAKQVAHAKEVAETQHRKLQEDAAARLVRLEARQKLVATRRQKLLTVPRSRLLDLQSWSAEELENLQNVLEDSAVILQQWWRKMMLLPSIVLYKSSGVTLAEAKAMNFDSLIKKMTDQVLINNATAFIQRIKKTSPTQLKWKNPARVFLSAYMIAAHPAQTMPQMGTEEMAVQKSAEDMILSFEQLAANSSMSKSYELTSTFVRALDSYYNTFEEWKKQDTAKIVDGMINHWLELERLWFSVRHTQLDADTNWRPKIASQQKSIYAKLSKFGKASLQKLRDEQKKMRSELGVESEDESISGSESDGGVSSSYESDTNSDALMSTSPHRFPSSPKPGRRGSAQSVSKSPKPGRKLDFSVDTISAVKQEEAPKVPPSPSIVSEASASSSSSASKFGAYLSNERLAHELVRDPEFELKPNQYASKLEEQVTIMAKKAFFDAARDQFNKGIFINFVPSLLEDIKKQLLGMVSGKGKIAGEIDEALDIALITQQIEKKVFDGQQCINYITTKMLQLCAPVRDQSIRNISSLYPDLASMFQECLSILEAMKFDLMNYQLKSIRPTLKAQAVEYEQTKFEQAVKSGAVSLEITKSWLTEAATNLQAIATARNPENIQLPDNLVKFEDVYHEALQKLLFSSTPVSRASCPETFLLDAERLFKFQNELQVITVVSALVMLAKNAVTQIRRDRAVVQKLRDRLFILLNDDGSNGESRVTVANLTEEIISVCTLALERPNGGEEPKLSSEIQTLIRNMVERTLSTKDTLYSMISRRIQGCVRGQMSTGVFRSITGMSLASAGLDVVEKELMEVSRKIAMLAKHNKDVYSKWYDEILKNVL